MFVFAVVDTLGGQICNFTCTTALGSGGGGGKVACVSLLPCMLLLQSLLGSGTGEWLTGFGTGNVLVEQATFRPVTLSRRWLFQAPRQLLNLISESTEWTLLQHLT